MSDLKYKQIQQFLKEQIQNGRYTTGDFLPSENKLCAQFRITRTTARKALDELSKEGFIDKLQGKGSRVRERRKSLGLLTVKGFSEAVGENVQTVMLQKPVAVKTCPTLVFWPEDVQKFKNCIYFERLRKVDDIPVMLEKNWFPGNLLMGFLETEFVEGSFFKTLSRKYRIEITGSEHKLRAEFTNDSTADLLKLKKGEPILRISVKFSTSNPEVIIFSELFCNTSQYPVGNSYFI